MVRVSLHATGVIEIEFWREGKKWSGRLEFAPFLKNAKLLFIPYFKIFLSYTLLGGEINHWFLTWPRRGSSFVLPKTQNQNNARKAVEKLIEDDNEV